MRWAELYEMNETNLFKKGYFNLFLKYQQLENNEQKYPANTTRIDDSG